MDKLTAVTVASLPCPHGRPPNATALWLVSVGLANSLFGGFLSCSLWTSSCGKPAIFLNSLVIPGSCCMCTARGSGCVALGGGDYDGGFFWYSHSPALWYGGNGTPEFKVARSQIERLVDQKSRRSSSIGQGSPPMQLAHWGEPRCKHQLLSGQLLTAIMSLGGCLACAFPSEAFCGPLHAMPLPASCACACCLLLETHEDVLRGEKAVCVKRWRQWIWRGSPWHSRVLCPAAAGSPWARSRRLCCQSPPTWGKPSG